MNRNDVFLSYSRNDLDAATMLRSQLEKCGLALFRDQDDIREGDRWLDHLQSALDTCGSFVLLVGRDGVQRWVAAEAEVALSRYFGPHDDAKRLPIFPILLGEATADGLPAFLRLFQATSWDGSMALPERLFGQIRKRVIVTNDKLAFEGCPFVGLDAYRPDQAGLFFGRQKETLDALACFDCRPGFPVVRWLEINGNSGSGKSSLMNAGLLPLIEQGWLWPRTRYANWRRIGPMMPGERPATMLAEHLARAFGEEMSEVRRCLSGDERALAEWLRGRKPDDDTAFLLAIDQFEELFTFADPDERREFDRLLAAALADADCPLFLISTVRADFLDRFEDLPQLVAMRNRAGRPWTLPRVSADGLREIIDGPARLAGIDAGEVREAMVGEAREEPGALPLVQNALAWLWERRENGRLCGRLLTEQGGIAGILVEGANELVASLDDRQEQALELLLRLVRIDHEGQRHTRRRLSLADALASVGGGDPARSLIDRLAGARPLDGGKPRGALRLITVAGDQPGETRGTANGASVSLIHETLIRSKGLDEHGRPIPYWPMLWQKIEDHREHALALESLRMRGLEIEGKAAGWHASGRPESDRLPAATVLRLMTDLAAHGLLLNDVLGSDAALAYVGPTRLEDLEGLPALDEAADQAEGAGRFGEAWRLPLSHRARASLGDRLAALDDRRQGVGLRADGVPDIAWHRIDGGEVTLKIDQLAKRGLRSAVQRLLSGAGRRNAGECRAVDAFWMARYPVTIRQFQAFVADCFRDGAWQLPDGVPLTGLENPRYSSPEARNQPATDVSWYHANAFCHWLGARLGLQIHLPTEFEWQLAATGGEPDNTYPWAPTWDPSREPWRANTDESGLGRATAVGLYPQGATRQGIMDMAGTVWEWCANSLDAPDSTVFPEDLSTGFRVLRGGSWGGLRGLARCAARRGARPYFRYGGVGFRVVCSSPIMGTDP